MLLGAVAAGIGLGTTARRQAKDQRLLQEQGVNTDARITRVWRSGDKNQQHLVSYRFTVQEREYVARKGVPPRIWQDLRAGSSLPVRFLPSNPKVNHPTGWDDTPMRPWVAYLVSGELVAIALVLTILLRKQMRLLTEGRPAPGIVTGQRRTKDGTVIRYDFTLLNGATAKGRGQSRRPPAIGSSDLRALRPRKPAPECALSAHPGQVDQVAEHAVGRLLHRRLDRDRAEGAHQVGVEQDQVRSARRRGQDVAAVQHFGAHAQ